MDPWVANEAPFTDNPSLYSLVDLLSFPMGGGGGGLGLKIGIFGGGGAGSLVGDASLEESTVTEQSGSRGGNGGVKRRREVGNSLDGDSSKLVSTSSANHDLIEFESNEQRTKASGSTDENGGLKTEGETNSGTSIKPVEEKSKPEPFKDYIHVRARRGQATDSHSLAERVRRDKISQRMKILQDLVPGCNKVIGKAVVLDEIINYIQSLQDQVEFLSMKLEAVTSRLSPTIEGYPSDDQLLAPTFDANGIIYRTQTSREDAQGTQLEWVHMQVGRGFERET